MVDFRGMSAFPLTPLAGDVVDFRSFVGLVESAAAAEVDSIAALGSTGSYAYLTCAERAEISTAAVKHAGGTPVIIGVGALRTSDVLRNVAAAEDAGASAVLLAPVTYQPLTEDEVFQLFEDVADRTQLPIIVYDNPTTTHFRFSMDLYQRIGTLPGIASLKIPGVPADPIEARRHIEAIRTILPENVTIGISGDAFAAAGLIAGCDAWYSVIGGLFPQLAKSIAQAALTGRTGDAQMAADRLTPLWGLFAEFGGSIRVVAAIAEQLGLAQPNCLPRPILGLRTEDRKRVAEVVQDLALT